ncbi:MAG: DUF4198 domain-containing protein [Gemmataceae bacterium]
MSRYVFVLAVACAAAVAALAHDTWVQTNTHIVRTGDAVHVDLMLGNHGNDHRDFKIAGKLAAASVGSFVVYGPDGKHFDLRPDLVDLGYAPKEGFHTAKFSPTVPGVYVAAQTSDTVVNHGKLVRSVRSAKAYFLASPSLDKVRDDWGGYDKAIGHPLELVAVKNPVAPMGPGTPIRVKLVHFGKALPGVKVSFVPRGVTLKEGDDPEYERVTPADGVVSFTPKAGNYYLVVAHHTVPAPAGETGYEEVKYAATLTVFVPDRCPCCAE